MDQAFGITGAVPTSTSNSLSGEVIAGLAVVGVILLAIIGVTIWGFVVRRRARRSMRADGTLPKSGRVGIRWVGVGYEVKPNQSQSWAKTVAWMKGSGMEQAALEEKGHALGPNGGKAILREFSGSLPPGGFCCILGPSGAGKSTPVDILAGKRKVGKFEGRGSFVPGGRLREGKGWGSGRFDYLNIARVSPTCSRRRQRSSRACCLPHSFVYPKTYLATSRSNAPKPYSPSWPGACRAHSRWLRRAPWDLWRGDAAGLYWGRARWRARCAGPG